MKKRFIYFIARKTPPQQKLCATWLPQLKVDGQVPFIVEGRVRRVRSESLHAGLRAALALKPPHELRAGAVTLENEERTAR